MSSSKSNILVLAITRLGDLLQASPTFVGLKNQYPGAKITVITDKSFASICEGIAGVDEVIEINLASILQNTRKGAEGLVDAFEYLDSFVEKIRERNFDMCVNFASSSYSSLLMKLFKIEDSRGWLSDETGHRLITSPWKMLFAAYVYHSNREFNSINIVDTMRCTAGVTEHPTRLMYEVPVKDRGFVDTFLESKALHMGTGPLICLQAGASQTKRQWAPVKFAALCRLLVEELDARIVMTGTKAERPIIDQILQHYAHPQLVNAAGETKLGELASLLQHSDLLVTGDTGTMHLGVAVGTPVVALFLASAHVFETGPYSAGNLVVQPQISCHPCNPNFVCGRPDCHDQVSPELLAYLVKQRLYTNPGEESAISIPLELAPPHEVQVYYSMFDQDNFLNFVTLNPPRDSKGYDPNFVYAVRQAYRALWKEEFLGLKPSYIEDVYPEREALPLLTNGLTLENGAEQALQLTTEGVTQLETLIGLIADTYGAPQELGRVNSRVNDISNKLEDLGRSCGPLGALMRMFVMERENLRGDDPLKLASQMRDIFSSLGDRGERFVKYFNYFLKQARNLSDDKRNFRREPTQRGHDWA